MSHNDNISINKSSANDGPTQGDKLKDFYGCETANMYAGMMEDEMVKYKDDFNLIFQTIQEEFLSNTAKPSGDNPSKEPIIKVLDTCFGSGHMLKYIGDTFKDNCALEGRDLSPDMLEVAKSIVPPNATLKVGNMLDMNHEADGSYHLVLNNFAMHHASPEQAEEAIQEYARILVPRGCLFFSAWEGIGKIDYGDMDFDANFHSEAAMKAWLTDKAGLKILNCRSFVEEDMGDMNSVYFVVQKEG